jgi:uncharacterized protein with von Willebrand factor type A (vWA) domain
VSSPTTLDAPYDTLEVLPRELWLPGIVTACGGADARLRDLPRWYDALLAGRLPPPEADFGDPAASHALRDVIGELALPTMAQGVVAAAQQVMRTALWHLDRLIDRPAYQPRADAIMAMAQAFRDEWRIERAEWEQIAALLRGMGDFARLSWDTLQGRLQGRDIERAQALSLLLSTAPEIVELIARIGRGIARAQPAEATPQVRPDPGTTEAPLVWRTTFLPDAPGEIHGVRIGNRLARMVPAEAAQLRHPVLHKLWRARLAEARLSIWDESALLVEAVHDPRGAPRAASVVDPAPRERGPMIVCVDTSGSMKGAPERLSKAVVIEAVRTAQREQRACHVIAFGGAGEVVEWQLAGGTCASRAGTIGRVDEITRTGRNAPASRGAQTDAGALERLLDFLGQAFDGGTDIAAPIERAIDLVNQHGWHEADILIASDGEFGSTPAALARLDEARACHGLRVEGLLIGDRETMGLLEVCDHIHWVRDWRRFDPDGNPRDRFSPVHSRSLTAMYFPNALSPRAAGRRP